VPKICREQQTSQKSQTLTPTLPRPPVEGEESLNNFAWLYTKLVIIPLIGSFVIIMEAIVSHRMRLLALLCVIVLSLSACNLPLKPVSSTPPIYLTIAAASAGTTIATNPPTQTPEIVTATAEATSAPTDTQEPVVQPSHTPKPPVQPSATPKPPAPPAPAPVTGAKVLAFAAGATSGDVTGHLQSGGQASYYFGAGAGQMLLAATYSKNDNMYMKISGADGSTLVSASDQFTNFQSKLSRTQAYYVTVFAGGGASDYTLQVILPFNIVFSPGAISASLDGYLASNQTNFYLLRALKGQTMTDTITSSHGDVFLTVYGITDGQPLVRSAMGQTSWSGKLPLTQDYMIEAVNTGNATNYTLKTVVK
jgi:hypothetical protein